MKTISALAMYLVAGAEAVRVTPTVLALAMVLLLPVPLIAGIGWLLRFYVGLTKANQAAIRKLILSVRGR
jgi:hypothetical protein